MPRGEGRSSADAGGPAALVARAHLAQRDWAAQPVRGRLRVLRRFRRRMAAGAHEMVQCLARPGRPDVESVVAELIPLADACRFLERRAAGLLRPRRLGWRDRPAWLIGVAAEIRREPFGVILVIAPANYPLLLPGVQILQALAAGNGVVVKPAPGCTAPLGLVVDWLAQAGLPQGLLHVLGESVEDASGAISAGVDKIVLTGSADTGRRVAAALGERLIPSTMELSGNDAVFVLPGADLGLVARALEFGLRFNGSATCIAPRRVFVGRSDARALEEALLPRLPAVPAVRLDAPLRRRVMQLVTEAIAAGATPIGGMADQAGPDMAAIVLADASPEMALLREDVFAPVLAIVPVDDMDQALPLARQSPYALGASVFGPARAAHEFAARIDAGSVIVNDVIVPTADPRLPFGGRRQSGWGVTRGAEGLLEMTCVKTVSTRRRGPHVHYDRPGPTDHRLLLAFFGILHGTGGTRWAAIRTLIGVLRERRQRREK